ncbi:MAG: FHA domain-containing protein [Planctomycetes bacterium]|nr:FHA domain-containing protein [Planctomycetota bacterium]
MATAILQITSGEHVGQTFLLEGPMTIGRDTGAQIRINDRSISRKHARIEQRNGSFHVVDLDSQNGTRLDGSPVTESPLPDTCRLQFGAIEAEFNVVSGEAAQAAMLPVPAAASGRPDDDSGWQSIPTDGQAVLDDIFRPPDSLDEIDKRAAKQKAEMQEKIANLAYIAVMILIVVGGVLLFMAIGNESSIPRQAISLNKYAKFQGEYRGERLVPYRGKGKFSYIHVEDESIAQVTIDSEYSWLLCVKGMEIGVTKVRFMSSRHKVIAFLTVVVMGEKPEPRETRGSMSDEDRMRDATLKVDQADILRADSPGQALTLYRQAEKLCRSMRPQPALYSQARQKARATDNQIEIKHEELKRQAKQNQNHPPAAVKYLNDICRLIPDVEDKRHQRAKIIIHAFYPEMTYKQMRQRR